MTIIFDIPGTPQGKARPRHTKSGHTYTPAQTREYEAQIALAYKSASKGYRYPDGKPLYMAVYAYYKIPQRASKRDRAAMLAGEIRPTVKPDVDNVCKVVADALNGVAYADDRLIVDAVQRKFYADEPRIVIYLREATEALPNERRNEMICYGLRRCKDCGEIMQGDELRIVAADRGEHFGFHAYEPWAVCPFCGSDEIEDYREEEDEDAEDQQGDSEIPRIEVENSRLDNLSLSRAQGLL